MWINRSDLRRYNVVFGDARRRYYTRIRERNKKIKIKITFFTDDFSPGVLVFKDQKNNSNDVIYIGKNFVFPYMLLSRNVAASSQNSKCDEIVRFNVCTFVVYTL